jgi:hypothetical protein
LFSLKSIFGAAATMGDINRDVVRILRLVGNLKDETDRLVGTFTGLQRTMESYGKKHKAANAFAGGLGIAGGILSFTPLFPIGLALLGAGAVAAVATDIVDSDEYRKFKDKIERELSSYNK